MQNFPQTSGRIAAGDNQKLNTQAKMIPYRAIFAKHFATGTYGATFAAANWDGTGLDIAAAAAQLDKPGEHIRNNFIGADVKPKFTFIPEGVGIYMSDPGAERVREWVIENARFTFWSGDSRLVNEPLICLPPGLGVVRHVAHQVSGLTQYSETHGVPSPNAAGVMPLAPGLVLDMSQKIQALVFLDETARAGLAALVGNTPPQGWDIAVVLYGQAAAKVGIAG